MRVDQRRSSLLPTSPIVMQTPPKKYYAVSGDVSQHIRFTADGRSIAASKFLLQIISLDGSYHNFNRMPVEIDAILAPYRARGYDVEAYDHAFFMYEQVRAIRASYCTF